MPKALAWSAALAALVVLGAVPAFSQDSGAVAGVVVNTWDGSALPGVVVTVRGTTLAAQTDASGRYELKNVPPGEHVLRFSKPGFATAVVTEVRVLPGQTTTVNGNLRPEFYEMEEYEVTAEEFTEQTTALLIERQSATALIEAIGSDRFSRLAAGDAAEIMTKITGVSVVDGKFAVIRGLSDRYNIALLNGADVPSADPYRRAAQLDLFPAEVIESVVVSKTFTPDLPGGFSGGAMNIRTKSFPDRFIFKAGAGVGYNTQATGNERFLTYPGGSTDWLAMDDGTRRLPPELRNVTGTHLEQLLRTATSGSLSIPFTNKTAAAMEMDRLVRSFGTPYMGPHRKAPPPDHDLNFLIGDTIKFGGVPVGYFAGMNYERDFRFYENGIRRRYAPRGGAAPHMYQDFEDTRATATAQWSALLNLAAQPFENHRLGYTFLFTQNAEDMARKLFGRIESSGEDQFNSDRRTHLNVLHWTERNLNAHQFRGEHKLPGLSNLQVDWLVSLATTTQDEPDLRYFNFISYPNPQNPQDTRRGVDLISNNTPFPERPTRYFRHLEDQNQNYKLDLTLPFEDGRGLEWKIKTGAFASDSERAFDERTFSYAGGSGSIVDPETFPYEYMLGTNAPPPQVVTIRGVPRRYEFSRVLTSVLGNNFYDGAQEIRAVYGMVEVPLVPRLRLMSGVRYETTFMQVASSAFGSKDVFTGKIDQADLLPAASLTWELRQDMHLRLSYAETVARPTYREFARYRSFDVTGDQIVEGNPFLKMTQVKNYDIRWEWFTTNGGLVSLGAFYKTLKDPIEKFNAALDPNGNVSWTSSGDFVTFLNTAEATAWGLEFEGRQSLGILTETLRPLSLGLNVAWINTEVPLEKEIQQRKLEGTGKLVTSRPLYDQSPLIINADISWDIERTGTAVTLVYYYAAERLALIVNNGYDVYEQPAPSLDLVVSQKLGKRFKARFTARNLLNPEIIRSYAVSGPTDKRYIYSSYTKGITLGLSLSYEL
ncbi:MAG: TonB-dependent receptor [Verrucomicrobiae bacterium]|nr:TonB-dependent receptor [Verrucomicrobiae bacterium]MCX7723406.1 TonB-dependent receptor [Verrucomicrobiae bacterium]MDW7979501.1 TonB-dependent receptor [Verrucomicrobiales bacterium]